MLKIIKHSLMHNQDLRDLQKIRSERTSLTSGCRLFHNISVRAKKSHHLGHSSLDDNIPNMPSLLDLVGQAYEIGER